jgi:deoxyribonuclease-1
MNKFVRRPILGALLLSIFAAPVQLCAQTLSADLSEIQFGSLQEGDPTAQVQVKLMNPLDVEVEVNDLLFTDLYGHVPFSGPSTPFTIPAGGEVSVMLYCDPVHNIEQNGQVIFLNNSGRGALTIDLSGQYAYGQSYYSSTQNQSGDALRSALETLLNNATSLTYNTARDHMFMTIDNEKVNGQGASVNTLTCVYTGIQVTGYSSRTAAQNMGFNTEHTFPQSMFNSAQPMKADLHHLFPTEGSANSTRSNHPFGIVANVTSQVGLSALGTNSGGSTVFEPHDGQKGATARAMLYFGARYPQHASFLAQQEGLMRTWSHAFPPTSVDIQRNNDIYSFQQNRNPFVDYPVLMDRVKSFSNSGPEPVDPEMLLAEQIINFAMADSAGRYMYEFPIVNTGDAPLILSNVTATGVGLSAEVVEPVSLSVAPGDAARIRIYFDRSGSEYPSGSLDFNSNVFGLPNMSIPISGMDLSVSGDAQMGAVSIYPNPVKDNVQFEVLGPWQIVNASGSKVASGTGSARLEVQSWPQGIYFLRYSGGSTRFVVQ